VATERRKPADAIAHLARAKVRRLPRYAGTAALRTDTIYRRETHRWIVAWFEQRHLA
jgi:hypothetical protein